MPCQCRGQRSAFEPALPCHTLHMYCLYCLSCRMPVLFHSIVGKDEREESSPQLVQCA